MLPGSATLGAVNVISYLWCPTNQNCFTAGSASSEDNRSSVESGELVGSREVSRGTSSDMDLCASGSENTEAVGE